ncbi:MAG TPA: muconolactone Delta-isomerase family protein [Chloroflexota bacterium]|nr:muconolactone Delta-isomerase family protein [Chloroflexota bacterium]
MTFMVTMAFDPARRAEIVARVPAEQARVRELMAQGAIETLHIARARDRVWLVLSAETEEAARRILESLPLHAYATVDLAPLADPT